MKTLLTAVALALLSACQTQSSKDGSQASLVPETNSLKMENLYQFSSETLMGENFDFSELQGKRVLIVNTASECGFTPQYEGLQKLYEKYGGEKFTVVGFPSNDFGKQEPGSNEEIQAFCKKNFGVTFPMMAKTPVTGDDKHPIYKWLTHKDRNGKMEVEVKWNFNKFLVDKKGNWVAYYPSKVKPMDERIVKFVQGG